MNPVNYVKHLLINITFIGAMLQLSIAQTATQYSGQQNYISFKGQQQEQQCASDRIHKRLMDTDPAYKAKILANESQIQSIIAKHSMEKSSTIYTIPIVVHIIHLGEAVGTGTNISDAQIQSAIDALNEDYRKETGTNGDGNGVDCEIEFCLASRDPNCNATSGIVRVNGTGIPLYSTEGITAGDGQGADEVSIKDLSRWSHTSYYNIWIVSEIENNNGGSGIQGYAYFPGASSAKDGAVILYNAFGTTGNLKSYTNMNRTTTHEIGHGLNLYHTFQGDDGGSQCPSDVDCGNNGDCCDDTPIHKRSSSTCYQDSTNECTGQSLGLVVHNYMDYSNQTCKNEFSSNQKTRMRAALLASRGSLVNSLACTAPDGLSPSAACTPSTNQTANYNMGVYGVKINTINSSSANYYYDGGEQDFSCYQVTNLSPSSGYGITVTTGSTYNENVKVFIDYNDDNDFGDAGEEVFVSNNTLETHTGTINTPSSPTTSTNLRMRVMSDYYSYSITSCGNLEYGQYEDYSVYFAPAGSPPVANFSASQTTTCEGQSINFTDLSSNTPTSWSWTFTGGTPASSTSQNPTITYNTAGTYNVTLVATNQYGSDTLTKTSYITINTPSYCVDSTEVQASQCNSTLSALDEMIVCNSAIGTEDVQWNVVNTGDGFDKTYTRGYGYSGFRLTQLTGIKYNLTYDVKVKIKVGGVWGNYGDVCQITTPASAPTTKVRTSQCNNTLSAINEMIVCNSVTGTEDVQWNVVNTGDGFDKTYTRGYGYSGFRLTQLTGIKYNLTYDVKVKIKVGGVWGNYGDVCQITTPVAKWEGSFAEEAKIIVDGKEAMLMVYPNPSDENGFSVELIGLENIGNNIFIDIYDMYGRRVFSRNIINNEEAIIEDINTNGKFANGIYLLNVTINGDAYQKKIVIQ